MEYLKDILYSELDMDTIKSMVTQNPELARCTLLGDGNISLIIDIAGLMTKI